MPPGHSLPQPMSLHACPELPNMIGRSASFLEVLALLRRVALLDAPVLVTGETGTGKELAARAIHYLSPRRHAPFVPLNCGALPDTLVESELFGCERGAFTDAHQSREGLAAAADGGTLFLDEVDALPPRAQVALLRFLQEHVFRRVGATRERHSNVRVVAAASPRLAEALRSGHFRDDLMFRLDVLSLRMPPLRERPGDALLLARHFIAQHARQQGVAAATLAPAAVQWLHSHAWPGNVRELDNVVQRALLLGDHRCLQLPCAAMPCRDTRQACADPAAGGSPVAAPVATADGVLPPFSSARALAMQAFEHQYLTTLMAHAIGNVSHAARLAGKDRRSLGRLLKRHGIDRLHFGQRPG